MKLVLDTNILISALVFSGVAADILEEAVRYHELFISQGIIDEFIRILCKKLKVPRTSALEYANFLRSGFHFVTPDTKLPILCRDPNDNHLLQLCEYVTADCMITGDKDLLVLRKYKQTDIIDMRTFRSNTGREKS